MVGQKLSSKSISLKEFTLYRKPLLRFSFTDDKRKYHYLCYASTTEESKEKQQRLGNFIVSGCDGTVEIQ
jgi:hypothetical protein